MGDLAQLTDIKFTGLLLSPKAKEMNLEKQIGDLASRSDAYVWIDGLFWFLMLMNKEV
jgi:hypothetical protein